MARDFPLSDKGKETLKQLYAAYKTGKVGVFFGISELGGDDRMVASVVTNNGKMVQGLQIKRADLLELVQARIVNMQLTYSPQHGQTNYQVSIQLRLLELAAAEYGIEVPPE